MLEQKVKTQLKLLQNKTMSLNTWILERKKERRNQKKNEKKRENKFLLIA